ncbi:hypothetical protein FNI87_16790 [Salmonella enterica subsp. salamae]|nr:hypothetical protein [Salmonella enterica subsp. salamae serovar Sofia]
MKLNKLAIILMMTGSLSCVTAHATPVEASATLEVGAPLPPLAFTHTLTAVEGLTADGVVMGGQAIANGMISANRPMEMIRLSWDRAVNPSYDAMGEKQGMFALMKGPTHDIPVAMHYDAGQVITDDIDETGISVYPSDHGDVNFKYAVNLTGPGVKKQLESGQYKLAILADVVVA